MKTTIQAMMQEACRTVDTLPGGNTIFQRMELTGTPFVELPLTAWEDAANGTGYYDHFTCLLEEVDKQIPGWFGAVLTRTPGANNRLAILFRHRELGQGIVFQRYTGGTHDVWVHNATGVIHHILGGSNIAPLGWGQLCTLFGMASEYDRDLEAPIEVATRTAAAELCAWAQAQPKGQRYEEFDCIAAIATMLAEAEYVRAEVYFTWYALLAVREGTWSPWKWERVIGRKAELSPAAQQVLETILAW